MMPFAPRPLFATAAVLLLPILPLAAAPKGEKLYALTPASFAGLKEAGQAIDPAEFNEELLSAAIFHESNRRRVENGLAALSYHAKVRKAALQHSRLMAKHGVLSHATPKSKKDIQPVERLRKMGLDPRYSAENIGFDFLVQYESGREFYLREGKDGAMQFSYEPQGPALPPHTYLSFAKLIVQEWLDSPEHRKNLLSPHPRFLGIGAALHQVEKNMDRIYATQNFFTPLEKPPW